MDQLHVYQVTIKSGTEQALGGLSRNIEGSSNLLLSFASDVIKPGGAGGLVKFILFSGGGH